MFLAAVWVVDNGHKQVMICLIPDIYPRYYIFNARYKHPHLPSTLPAKKDQVGTI